MARLVIVGGVAGGASAAARARRLDETLEIVIYDRGPHVSFANCGLPYFVGDVILDEAKLLVATPELFRERFNIEVRLNHEVLAIDAARRTVSVRDLKEDRTFEVSYDHLLLSPGARPLRPPLEGLDLPGVFALRTVPDSKRIRAWIEARDAKHATVVGGGFIGLEMAENFKRRGLDVAVIEREAHVLPPFDEEMARPLGARMRAEGVDLYESTGLAGIAPATGASDRLEVRLSDGRTLETDLVLLSVGVRPEVSLAADAGLALGPLGGLQVDARMRTSIPGIWAVGDAVESVDAVNGAPVLAALAGPAQRQGRVAASDICDREARFRGVQRTAVCGAFGLTCASTGHSESALRRVGCNDVEAVLLHPGHHAGYYPGAKPLHLKLVFSKTDGRVLGAQAIGEAGVERRIDVIATFMQMGGTVHDLAEAELCYAPQYGAAKDPVNIAGMIAGNLLRGDFRQVRWAEVEALATVQVVDVRNPSEVAAGAYPGALLMPLDTLRNRLGELDKARPVAVYCAAGQRGYYAARLLAQHGFDVYNVAGGMQSRHAAEATG